MSSGIFISQAAIHAGLKRVYDLGADMASLAGLIAMLDPAHSVLAPSASSLPVGPGSASDAVDPTPAEVSVPYDTGAATAMAPAQAAPAPSTTRAAEAAAVADPPAPPQDDAPAEPGPFAEAAGAASVAQGAEPAPVPPLAQAAAGSEPRARSKGNTPNTGRAGGVWTAERDQALTRVWHEGATAAEALAIVNEIAASQPAASEQAIYNRARELKLRRPPEVRAMLLQRSGRMGAERAAELAAAGQSTLGVKPIVWTKEREAVGRRMWEAGEPADTILRAVNQLPAVAPVLSAAAIRTHASHKGWKRPESFEIEKRRRYAERMRAMRGPAAAATDAPVELAPPAAPEASTPAEEARIADAAVLSKQERVRESLRTALVEHKGSPSTMVLSSIGDRAGMPLREVMRLLSQVRAERAEGAAA